MFEAPVGNLHLTVEVIGLSTDTTPVIATRPEFMRRMKDMANIGGCGMASFYASMPEEVSITVNGNHPVYQKLLKADRPTLEKSVRSLADLALLSQGLLKGNDLTNFIHRSVDLMTNLN